MGVAVGGVDFLAKHGLVAEAKAGMTKLLESFKVAVADPSNCTVASSDRIISGLTSMSTAAFGASAVISPLPMQSSDAERSAEKPLSPMLLLLLPLLMLLLPY